MKYSEVSIEEIYSKNLELAVGSLAKLPITKGREPKFQGLNGWVYEQTLRSCLEDELERIGITLSISEQVKLKGRAKADLLVGRTAIEIKAGGLFGDDSEKYGRYKKFTNEMNIAYLYITRHETYRPYYLATQSVFGEAHSFFLSEKGTWERFISTLVSTNLTP